MKHARKNPWYRVNPVAFVLAALVAFVLVCSSLATNDAMNAAMNRLEVENAVELAKLNVPTASKQANAVPQAKQEETQNNNDNKESQEQTVDWKAATGSQPDLSKYSNISVDVSLADQKVYVKSGDEVIYTMIASTGIYDTTPTGDFTIHGRGDHFFNSTEGMGADYWVAFSGTTFLFHSVPTTAAFGDYIESEAVKLGTAASHGCVRLTVADSKWFYEQVVDGTPVHIG